MTRCLRGHGWEYPNSIGDACLGDAGFVHFVHYDLLI